MSLRQCDGPDLDELLAQAARDHGPSARVVKAEKVRRGGVGGFFAREWFELSVEVPDGAADIDALAEETEDVLDLSGSAAGNGAKPAATADDTVSLGGLFAAGEPEERPVDLPSTEQSEFEALLASLTGGPRPQPHTAPETATPRAAAVDADAATGHPAVAMPQDLTPAAAKAQPATGQPALRTSAARTDRAVRASAARNQPAESTLTDLSRRDLLPPPGSGSVSALARAGLPRDLITGLAGLSPVEWPRALDQMLPSLPALPQLPGSILAVVGTAAEATRLAVELSRRTGGAGEIHLLSRGAAGVGVPPGMVMPDAAAVDERARRFARSSHPVVVAVAVDGAPGVTRWLADVVGRLRPDQTWLCADAAARPDDVSALGDVLGGIDVLTLSGAHRATAPATLLSLQLPVALIDDDPSVMRAMAALLRERVDDPLPDQIAVGVTGQPMDHPVAGRTSSTRQSLQPPARGTARTASGTATRTSRPTAVSTNRGTQRRAAAARVSATDDAVARLRGRAGR